MIMKEQMLALLDRAYVEGATESKAAYEKTLGL